MTRTVHPYESVYRDSLTLGEQTFQGLLMGKSVNEVRAFWIQAGIEAIHPYNYPPDHIGMELGFIVYLGREFMVTREEQTLDLARRFLKDHLLAWVPQFCTDLGALDVAYFYKPIAQITHGFLITLAQHLGLVLNQED